MKFFTADTHFGHTAIIEYCKRPFKNSDEMDHKLIKNINKCVSEIDELFILGDLTLRTASHKGYIKSILNKIRCPRIHLILGNHDSLKPFDYIELGICTVHTHLHLESEDLFLCHDPAVACVLKNKTWLCGHVHDLFLQAKNVINVGVDVHDYYPISLDDVNVLRRK